MFGQGQSAGTGDHGMNGQFKSQAESWAFFRREAKRFLNVGKMPFIIGKKKLFFLIQNCNLHSRGTDVDS